MHRYIAFAWNVAIDEKNSVVKTLARRVAASLQGWQTVLATDGLQVYHFGSRRKSCQTYLLDQHLGVVIGKIFEHRPDTEYVPRELAFNESESQKIMETQGRHLTEHYWGRYVALLREGRGVRTRILRDPTGAMPCFITRFLGIDVICSHIEDCATLGLVNSTINWDHIVAYLWARRLVTTHTGLDEVQEIQAGECMVIGVDRSTTTYHWNPDRIHDMRLEEDPPQAMRKLRIVIQHCVGAWASCYDQILHELSGGLDSAVVLACLAKDSVDANVVCENFFTEVVQGDERYFARKAAKSAGFALVETPLRATDVSLEKMLDSTKVATPTLTNLTPEYRLTRNQVIRAHGIEAVFSGQGGDHFFLQRATRLIAAEYAWRHGLSPHLFRVAIDTSRFTGRPIWSVMAKALGSGLLRLRDDPYTHQRPPPLLDEATWSALDRSSVRHPWVDNASRLPGSKVAQILDIVDSQNFYRIPPTCADMVHPLISQPIIELCLQIPSYVLTYGGTDRALVRDAFADSVPPEITMRRVKGTTTNYMSGLLVQNLTFLRGLLLDGLLVRKRVLDRKKVEAALTESALARDTNLLFPVLNAIQAEAWLRAWTSDGCRTAA